MLAHSPCLQIVEAANTSNCKILVLHIFTSKRLRSAPPVSALTAMNFRFCYVLNPSALCIAMVGTIQDEQAHSVQCTQHHQCSILLHWANNVAQYSVFDAHC